MPIHKSSDLSCRLGFIIDFLAHPAVVGFMSGAAVTIALQQLKGLLNITKGFTTNTDIVSVLRSVFEHTDEVGQRDLSEPSATLLAPADE